MKDNVKFSQNFLRDPNLVTSLLSKTNISESDTVYDIGGGNGIITAALAKKSRMVICIEVDPRLAAELRDNLRSHGNVLVYEADFLSLPLPQTSYKVFSNIPFNLSADILRKLTDTPYPPDASYLIVQREFASKLIPKLGGFSSQLSILLGVRFEIRIVQRLQPSSFYPRPRVAATLLEILPRVEPLVKSEDLALYRDFITYTFNAHQPSIAVGLSRLFAATEFGSIAERLHFSTKATPTQLDLQQWLGLFAFALQDRSALQKLVGGQEHALGLRHHKRTKSHRTRHGTR